MTRKEQDESFRDVLDAIFAISSKARKDEDSFCCSCTENAALIGVFDGSGGLGSTKYKHYEGHTGAYIASRLASGAVYDWFQVLMLRDASEGEPAEVEERLAKALSLGQKTSGEKPKLKGSMVREFPTTAAFVVAEQIESRIYIESMWAGDSRVYFLDHRGLSPLSVDDTDSRDAFESLRNDPAQKNVLSSDGKFTLHRKKALIKGPIAVITATDGYYGYWNTPMELEFFLLNTLNEANSLNEWKNNLRTQIREISRDDSTMAVMLFYFGTFKELKKNYEARHEYIKEHYIRPLSDHYTEERAKELWQEYRQDYERYMN